MAWTLFPVEGSLGSAYSIIWYFQEVGKVMDFSWLACTEPCRLLPLSVVCVSSNVAYFRSVAVLVQRGTIQLETFLSRKKTRDIMERRRLRQIMNPFTYLFFSNGPCNLTTEIQGVVVEISPLWNRTTPRGPQMSSAVVDGGYENRHHQTLPVFRLQSWRFVLLWQHLYYHIAICSVSD